MNQPTEGQIQWFWEQRGFEKIQYVDSKRKPMPGCVHYVSPDKSWGKGSYPPIDLNNLFKYAVPKVCQKTGISDLFEEWLMGYEEDDPALALFWAIYKAFGGDKMNREEILECPFGIEARFCKHQETRAKDILSAMAGDFVFICKLKNIKDCPKLKEVKENEP